MRFLAVSAGALLLGAAAAPDELSRRVGAITGAALADAAAMPLHWIYDTSVIAHKLGKGTDAAFFEPPSCPFYHYPEGENTPYGQQNRVVLASLAAHPMAADANAIQDNYWAFYGPEGAPCKGCYLDGSTKGFLSNYRAGLRFPHVGADDDQANAIVHMVPVVAALAGSEGMLAQVESVVRVTQNSDKAVAFALAGARVLSRVVLGQTLLEAVTAGVAELRDPAREQAMEQDASLADGLERMLGSLDWPNFDIVKEVGQSCAYPSGLWSGSQLAGQLSPVATANGTEAFMLAVRQTIEAGGDSGSRGGFVGALFGAAAGDSALPAAWKAKYLHYDEVLGNAKTWIQGRTERIVYM